MSLENQKRFQSKFLTTLRWIMPFIWGNQPNINVRIFLALFFTGLMIVFNVAIPYVFKTTLDLLTIAQQNAQNLTIIILIFYGILWTLGQMVTHVRAILLFSALERGIRFLSIHLFDHLLSLSLRFHTARKTGAITSAITRAQYAFEVIFWGLLIFIIPTIVEMVIIISLLTYFYGFFYGFLILLTSLLLIVFSFFALERSAKVHKTYNDQRSMANARVVDSLLNFETIKYSGNEYYEHLQCNQLLKNVEKTGVAKYLSETFVQIGQQLMIGVGLLLLTVFSGYSVIKGHIKVSDFVLINGYLLQFIGPLNHFGYILRQIRQGFNDLQEAIELSAIESDVKDAPHAIDLKIDTAKIIFKNVDFSYDGQRTVLNNISFTVEKGKTVAIVGPSGSGKSTIARLLFRFYDVGKGSILINNHDIRSVTQQSLRAAIGVVPQDTVLFNDTLYYNISYSRPEASRQDIELACKLAHLEELVTKLSEGYDTVVGERGLKLSGGEKQRIAIARAILKKPAIYLFDEATSSLDTNTEQEIQKNLEEISSQATTIIIAHRLSTIVHAQEILVLENGSIIERGTHHTLLEQNGLYAQLWHKQQGEKNS